MIALVNGGRRLRLVLISEEQNVLLLSATNRRNFLESAKLESERVELKRMLLFLKFYRIITWENFLKALLLKGRSAFFNAASHSSKLFTHFRYTVIAETFTLLAFTTNPSLVTSNNVTMKKLLTFVFLFQCNILLAQNVGIGTTTPLYKLDVMGRMRVKTGTLNSPGTSSGIWMEDYRDGSNQLLLGMQDSIRFGMYGSGSGGTGWGFNFNTKTGNVGIGRIAGNYRLELDNSTGGDAAFFKSGSYAGSIAATDTTIELVTAYGNLFSTPSTPAKNLVLVPPTSFIFAPAGSVGIGTHDPTAKLHVLGNAMIGSGTPASGYQLSVNGKIISEEIKVQLDGNWPDYVFQKNYTLPTLPDLEKFINLNHHLPNIPAASEVEKDGISLGDMQKRVLEKVEELTLYVIELNKQNEELRNQINELKVLAGKK